MPIDIADYALPKWIKIDTRYPLSANQLSRFMRYEDYPRNYRGGEDGKSFPQGGYNPNHQSTQVEKINMYTDEFTLKKR
jgi:hypothetical protein